MSSSVVLRDYQQAAHDRIFEEFDRGIRSTLLVLPTGCGKTVVFGSVARRVIEERGGRVLILAHRGELLTQAADRLADMGLDAAIEKAERNARAALWGDPACVVASVQTMRGDRLRSWPRGHFDLLVVDEAHHAPADSYKSIYDHFSTALHLGVTATADRLDGENLGQVYQTLAYEYSLREAIEREHLCRLRFVRCETTVDLSDIRTTGGDLNQGDIEEAIRPYIDELANATRQEIGDRRAIVFTPDVGSAEAFASALCSLGLRAESIAGCSRDREEILDGFRKGRFRILTNCALLTEGFDAPFVSAIVLARPTKSRGLYCLDAETEVLTRRGWVGPDEIRDDDIAAAFDLDDSSIGWSRILARVDRPLDDGESMMGIASPSLDIRVSDRHRMVVGKIVGRAKRRLDWQFVEAKDLVLAASNYEIPVSGIERADGLPLSDHEIEFIGWFMTDGGLHRTTNAITIYQAAASPYHGRIKACIEGCGFKYGVYSETRSTEFSESSTIIKYAVSKGQPRGRDKHLTGWADLEPYIDKDFAPALDGLSRNQLAVLIDAMNCGDGLKPKAIDWVPATTSICTGNRTMADRLQSLCVRRGFRCNVSTGHWNARPIYIIRVKDEQARYVGGCNLKDRPTFGGLEFVQGERVWCVSVETEAIVTRRKGKVAIVGNSQMIGRGTRRAPNKPDCLIVDFAWLTGRHQLVTPVELFDTTKMDQEVQALARAMVEAGQSPDLLEAIEAAEAQHRERQKVRIVAREREVRYRRVSYDPFAAMETLGMPSRPESEASLRTRPSEKQVSYLEKMGVTDARSMSRRRASMMLDVLVERRQKQMATLKQVSWCVKLGVEPEDARKMSFSAASAFLDRSFQGGRR